MGRALTHALALTTSESAVRVYGSHAASNCKLLMSRELRDRWQAATASPRQIVVADRQSLFVPSQSGEAALAAVSWRYCVLSVKAISLCLFLREGSSQGVS